MKLVKKIFKIILWFFLISIALYSTCIIFQKIFFKSKTPSFFGYKDFIVLTGSMEPTLNEGDIVIVKETNNIEENDIISFKINNSVVTHRVQEIYNDKETKYYITKGDANTGTDTELISLKDVEGKYIFKIAFLGKIILFFQRPIGIITLFIGLVIFLIINSRKPNKSKS